MTIATQFHLRFRSFEEWREFTSAWLHATGESAEYHRAVAAAFDRVVSAFPIS